MFARNETTWMTAYNARSPPTATKITTASLTKIDFVSVSMGRPPEIGLVP